MIAWLAISAILQATPTPSRAPQPRPDSVPLSPVAFKAVKAVLDYDRSVPLDVKLIEVTQFPGYARHRISYQGWRGRLPAYLVLPKTAQAPFPVVLLIHVGNSSKETWWRADGPEFGIAMRDSLLNAGFAILAIDTQGHGERVASNDFIPVATMFADRRWIHRVRDIGVETAVDLRRALDYLETRPDIDIGRVSVVGTSMGGVVAALVAATDDRIRSAVIGVAAIESRQLYPFRPLDIAPGLHRPATLIMAGRTDEMITLRSTERFATAVSGPRSQLTILESGHGLPAEYIGHSMRWLRTHGQ